MHADADADAQLHVWGWRIVVEGICHEYNTRKF